LVIRPVAPAAPNRSGATLGVLRGCRTLDDGYSSESLEWIKEMK
jgi:hypothetical protein